MNEEKPRTEMMFLVAIARYNKIEPEKLAEMVSDIRENVNYLEKVAKKMLSITVDMVDKKEEKLSNKLKNLFN